MKKQVFDLAKDLVLQAGEIVAERFETKKQVKEKSFGNFVTQVDFEVQYFIRNGLSKILPESSFIGEENYNRLLRLNKYIWILDPIDGTTNLVHGYPHMAISLALYEKYTGLFGIVYNPINKEMFTGIANGGAFINNKAIETSKFKTLDECIIGYGLPYKRSKANTIFKIIESLHPKCQDFRRSGSAALDLAYVACGRLDGYFELDLRPWDFAAGKIILEEAGGTVTKWDGAQIDVLKSNNIVATNGLIHEDLLTILGNKRVAVASPIRRRRA